jgi:hypothetical protein
MFRNTTDYAPMNPWDRTLDREDFPECCGIDVLHSFGYTRDAGRGAGARPDKKKVAEFLKKKIEDMRDNVDMGGASSALVALNEDQMKELWSTFEKQGFRKLTKFFHPGHENYIYLLFKPAYRGKQDAMRVLKKAEKEWRAEGATRFW